MGTPKLSLDAAWSSAARVYFAGTAAVPVLQLTGGCTSLSAGSWQQRQLPRRQQPAVSAVLAAVLVPWLALCCAA